MKKAIVLGAAMLLAGAAVFAAEEKKGPAVKFGGNFQAGYAFQFGSEKNTTKQFQDYDDDKLGDVKLTLSVSDADGLWSVAMDDFELKNGKGEDAYGPFAGRHVDARATIDLSKSLALAGVDTGDFSVKLSVGNKSEAGSVDMLTAYGDWSGKHYQRNRIQGDYTTYVDVAYGKLVSVRAATSPMKKKVGGDSYYPFALSAKVSPVAGVDATVDYGYVAKTGNTIVSKHSVGGSVKVDAAKLLSLDGYKLYVGAVDHYGIDTQHKTTKALTEDNQNILAVTLGGGVDMVDGYVEYSRRDDVNGLKVGANLNLVKGLGLSPYWEDTDLDEDGWKVGLDTSYLLGSVTWHLDMNYATDGYDTMDKEGKAATQNTFTVSPYVSFAF